jgi:hypothetical protein
MRRFDPVTLGSVVAIVCCIALPLLIPSGLAILLIATGVSLPVVALAIGAVWLSRSRRRRERRSVDRNQPDDGRVPGSRSAE